MPPANDQRAYRKAALGAGVFFVSIRNVGYCLNRDRSGIASKRSFVPNASFWRRSNPKVLTAVVKIVDAGFRPPKR